MNIKLKRTTRTPYSEEITIFDTDNRDAEDNAVSIGKLDVHYLDDQIVGTLPIWQEYATGFNRMRTTGLDETIDTLIDDILTEVSEPMGVPAEYGIEVFYPSIASQGFFSNYSDEDSGAAENSQDISDADYELEEDRPNRDDFAKRLQSRP